MIVVRTLLVPWILFVTVFLCAKGYWWALVFLPFLVLDLWLLRSLVRYTRAQGRDREARPPVGAKHRGARI
jgi:hypothetical protein